MFLVAVKLAENCLSSLHRPARLYLRLRPTDFVYFWAEQIRDFFKEYITAERTTEIWLSVKVQAAGLTTSSVDKHKPVNPEIPFGVVFDWFVGENLLERSEKAVELTFHVGNYPKKLLLFADPGKLFDRVWDDYLDVLEQELKAADAESVQRVEAEARKLTGGNQTDVMQFVEREFNQIGEAKGLQVRLIRTYSKMSGDVKTVKVEADCPLQEFLATHHPELFGQDGNLKSDFRRLQVSSSGVILELTFNVLHVAARLGFAGLQVDLVLSLVEESV
jgi:hypothetical protein